MPVTRRANRDRKTVQAATATMQDDRICREHMQHEPPVSVKNRIRILGVVASMAPVTARRAHQCVVVGAQ